jgi:hypothetical protein
MQHIVNGAESATLPLGEPPCGGHVAGPLAAVTGTIENTAVGLIAAHVANCPYEVTFGQAPYRVKVDEHENPPGPHVQAVQPRPSE